MMKPEENGKVTFMYVTILKTVAGKINAEFKKMMREKAEEFKIKGPRDDRMEPPYNTISIGTIEGGTAHNIIAGSCKLVWGCRSIAKEDAITHINDLI